MSFRTIICDVIQGSPYRTCGDGGNRTHVALCTGPVRMTTGTRFAFACHPHNNARQAGVWLNLNVTSGSSASCCFVGLFEAACLAKTKAHRPGGVSRAVVGNKSPDSMSTCGLLQQTSLSGREKLVVAIPSCPRWTK